MYVCQVSGAHWFVAGQSTTLRCRFALRTEKCQVRTETESEMTVRDSPDAGGPTRNCDSGASSDSTRPLDVRSPPPPPPDAEPRGPHDGPRLTSVEPHSSLPGSGSEAGPAVQTVAARQRASQMSHVPAQARLHIGT